MSVDTFGHMPQSSCGTPSVPTLSHTSLGAALPPCESPCSRHCLRGEGRGGEGRDGEGRERKGRGGEGRGGEGRGGERIEREQIKCLFFCIYSIISGCYEI